MKFIAHNNTDLKELFKLISEFMNDTDNTDENYFPARITVEINPEDEEADGDLYVIDDHKVKSDEEYYGEQAKLELEVMLQLAVGSLSDRISRVDLMIREAKAAEIPDENLIRRLTDDREHLRLAGQAFSEILSGKGRVYTSISYKIMDGKLAVEMHAAAAIPLADRMWALCVSGCGELDIREVDVDWEPVGDNEYIFVADEFPDE